MTRRQLNEVRRLQNKIAEQRAYIDNLNLSIENLVPIRDENPQPPPQGSDKDSRVERLAIKLVEAGKKLDGLLVKQIAARLNLTELIMAEVKNPNVQKVALLRYVECLSYRAVAREMSRSVRWVFKLHERLMKKHVDL